LKKFGISDREIHRLSSGVCDQLQKTGDTGRWWAEASLEDRGRLWLLLQRLNLVQTLYPQCASLVQPVLVAFQEAKFCMVTADMAEPDAAGGAIWFLTGEPTHQAEPVPSRRMIRGLVLVGPDGKKFGPCGVWLRSANAHSRHGRVTAISDHAFNLRLIEPEVAWLSQFNVFIQAASGETDDARGVSGEVTRAAISLLNAVYVHFMRSAADRTNETRGIYRMLIQDLYRCLVEDWKCRLMPELDIDSLQFARLKDLPPPPIAVVLRIAETEPGVILGNPPFTLPGTKAEWEVSCGASLPKGLASWLPADSNDPLRRRPLLPPPVFSKTSETAKPFQSVPLSEWHKKLPSLALRPDDVVTHDASAAREQFTRWAGETTEGREWFHLLVVNATQPETPNQPAAREWLGVLQREGWCRCYPEPAGDEGYRWPSDASPLLNNITWEPNSTIQQGMVIGPVERFAIHPSYDCCLPQGVAFGGASLSVAKG